MINGAGEPVLQNTATLANQQQQTNVKATGETPTTAVNDGDSQSTVTPSTIVSLGAKQAVQLTYSKPIVQTVAAGDDQSNVIGGIRKPPPESSATIAPLEAAAPDGEESEFFGGIKRPPP
jgi:hypothetical protein